MNKKKVLIAWSGGLDSTYLIHHYLTEGYSVDVVNCNLQNASTFQMKREQRAIKKMMRGYFKNKDVRLLGTSKISFLGSSFARLPLSQVPTWIYNLINYLQYDHTEVAVGYVMNDDAISFLDDIRGVWNSYSGLIYDKLPPLVFPLIKHKKTFIHQQLPEELRKNITWCENFSAEDQCGVCLSCKRMIDIGLQPPKETPALGDMKDIPSKTVKTKRLRKANGKN